MILFYKMKKKIAIFIISFNRLHVLSRSIKSFVKLIPHNDIYIIDTGSTYKPLLLFYEGLKKNGVSIDVIEPLKGDANDLNRVAEVVNKYKNNYNYYAVTDPDVSLEETKKDVLDVYISLLDKYKEIDIVGPMLRIDDIPKEYPAKEWALKKHVEQFWHKTPQKNIINNNVIFTQEAQIDTTFGVLRSASQYRRLLNGLRVYAPYEALHLDWYITPKNITEDQKYYLATSNEKISHWNGNWLLSPPEEKLRPEQRLIFVVKKKLFVNKYIVKQKKI